MKCRFETSLCIFFSLIGSVAYAQEFQGGTIHFNTTELSYGTIKKDSDGARRFIVTNIGKQPLVITQCAATCGCTVVNCPMDPIPAGRSALINVRYNTSRQGEFSKQITIYSNDQKSPMSVLRIYGTVE